HMTVVVTEPITGITAGQVQRPHQERRHLTASHVIVRAEPRIRRRIAPTGHTRRRQTIDITLEHARVVIDELVPTTVIGVTQRTHQERRHLTTSHVIVRAEPIVDGWIAATSDPLGGQPLDIRLEHMAVVVGEADRTRWLRWLRTRIRGVRRRLVGATPTVGLTRPSRRLAATTALTRRVRPTTAVTTAGWTRPITFARRSIRATRLSGRLTWVVRGLGRFLRLRLDGDMHRAFRRQLRRPAVGDPHLELQLSRTSTGDPRKHTRRRPDRRPSRRPHQRKRETLTGIRIRRHSSERQLLPQYHRLIRDRKKNRRLIRSDHRDTNGAFRRQLRGPAVGDPHLELQLSRTSTGDPRHHTRRRPDRRPSRRPHQRKRETLTGI